MMEIFQINIKKEENKKMNVELGRERERENYNSGWAYCQRLVTQGKIKRNNQGLTFHS